MEIMTFTKRDNNNQWFQLKLNAKRKGAKVERYNGLNKKGFFICQCGERVNQKAKTFLESDFCVHCKPAPKKRKPKIIHRDYDLRFVQFAAFGEIIKK